jgi:hypothetical protein
MKKVALVLGLLVALLMLASAVWAAENVMLDSVDLGSNGTEEGHDLDGWGRSATDETGGNYGGIGAWGTCRLVWDGDSDGPDATVSLHTPHGSAQNLKVHHLDGSADDSFDVYVQHANKSWVYVGSYSDQYSTENWVETDFDLSAIGFGRGRDLRVKIEATGSQWSGFPTWGQLCIDWIELYGDGTPQ